MESTQVELLEEIADLQSLVRNLNLQLAWAKQQNVQLRIRLNRAESVMGLEEAA